jgi:rhamnosyltransferase
MHLPQTSFIIHTYNDEKWIRTVLEKLTEQTNRNFEIIIIDSESKDNTLKIINQFKNSFEFPLRIFTIKKEDFSYPFSRNFGCKKSKATNFLCFISGHSIPTSNTWLADGLSNFNDQTIMGVFGPVWTPPDGTFIEKLFQNKLISKLKDGFRKKIIYKKDKLGLLGFTNAIIRKDLWKKRSLNEAFGSGGDDRDWANYWFKKGFYTIKDHRFAVYHSHGLGFLQFIQQYEHRKILDQPYNYRRQSYRK